MLLCALLALLHRSWGSGTGGHAHISGFFQGAHTEYVDHLIQDDAHITLVQVTLSGDSWNESSEAPGRLAKAIFSSNRRESGFMAQLSHVKATRLSQQQIQLAVFPMPKYRPNDGATEFITPQATVPAELLASGVAADIVWGESEPPVVTLVSRSVCSLCL